MNGGVRWKVALLAFTVLLLQATGLDVLIAPRPCALTCTSDGPEGDCAPFCADCICCPALRNGIPLEIATPPPAPARLAAGLDGDHRILPALPEEIFHVPRSALL
jgi:hypothetical protein